MKLFLVRHGETEGNKEGIVLGWKNSQLTPLGIMQSEEVAKNCRTKISDLYFLLTSGEQPKLQQLSHRD